MASSTVTSVKKEDTADSSYIAKRLFDIGFSLVALIPTLPLMALIALFIKIESRGPAILKQERIGFRGQPFTIYKFRTMHTTTPLYQKSPDSKTDTRITPLGLFLRRSSLDELPQFFNILNGTMSVVGPRPEMSFIVATYTPEQRKRLEAKPGLTGLWQVSGRKDLPLTENLEFDFYYIDHQSILLDSKIILKTIPAVLFRRGAY